MDPRILSRSDIEFMLYDWLDVETLTQWPQFADHSRETFDAVLALCERLATDKFANHNRKADREEARVEGGAVRMVPEVGEALAAYGEAGLVAAAHVHDLGGMQLPMVVERAGFAWFLAANMATSAFPFLTVGNANLILAYGTKQMVDLYVRPMLEGRFFGTMCLSEPHAGSSLAQIRTRALPQWDIDHHTLKHASGSLLEVVVRQTTTSDGPLPQLRNVVAILQEVLDCAARSYRVVSGTTAYLDNGQWIPGPYPTSSAPVKATDANPRAALLVDAVCTAGSNK